MPVLSTKDFDLQHTLESGQFFLWEKQEDWYYLIERESLFRVQQKRDKLFFEGVPRTFLVNFFGLDDALFRFRRQWNADSALSAALETSWGLRIMRQDPWQCLAGFVCSAMSNIKKIRFNTRCLAERFGKPLRLGAYTAYSFPAPHEIDDMSKLDTCGLGFRGKWLWQAAHQLTDGQLDALRNVSYETAREQLMNTPGIGGKIADCIALFALGKRESFPIDIWIERALRRYYFKRKATMREMQAFARERWGDSAGYAQQYLYHWIRHGKKER